MGGYLLTYYAVALGITCVLGLFALAVVFLQYRAAKGHPTAVVVNVTLLTLLTLLFIGVCITDFWGHETLWRRTLHGLCVFVGGAKSVEEWRKALRFFRGRHEPTPTAPHNAEP